MMKSAGVFLATVLLALTSGTAAGAATGETGVPVTASAAPDGDSGWGRSTGR
ncbi:MULTISPECIES: hypothetical protein [Streptomyces]|nr:MULTISPECIES: hypothetical protein [Streptomyces]MDQ0293054.1 hypothetical protein [Streptomyces sp. DSM 41037]WPR53404.1 hypothetical protein SJI45_22470 [Streptomyces sp. S399]